jgi:putative DNA primase/helicase
MAKDTARAIDDELQRVADEKREALRKHATYSEKDAGRRAMLNLAQSELPTNQSELDAHPWLLNLQNGTLDLNTSEFREHSPADKLTKVSPVRFDPTADCPTWSAFLHRIFEGDPETIFFVQQMTGYVLTADTREQCFFLLHGTGANGKSTLLNTLLFILGDYGRQADFETVLAKNADGGPRNDLAALVGARLVAASEGERGRRLAESMVKQITGGDAITCRKLYGEPFTYSPEFKLLLSTNHKPRIAGTDHAIWRRVRLVPFNVTISEDEKDPELLNKLKSESSGILNWMLQGLESWKEKGLIQAQSVKDATATYRGEQDALGPFIMECCSTGDAMRAKLSELYETYQQWTKDAGEQPITKRAFAERLTERGFSPRQGTGNVRFVFGLGIRQELMS